VVLVNLLGVKKVSIGTVMEIAFAHARQIPVILLIESDGNPHEHPMIEQAIAFRVCTVEAALNTIRIVCNV
jgi:nucleoside 2-deoxyribosyltransferase